MNSCKLKYPILERESSSFCGLINKFCRRVQDFAGKKNLRVNLINFAGKFKYTPIKFNILLILSYHLVFLYD